MFSTGITWLIMLELIMAFGICLYLGIKWFGGDRNAEK